MVLDELLKYKGQPGFEYLDDFGKGTKKCSRCGEVKDSALFHKDSKGKDGLSWECRECAKESRRKYQSKCRERNAGKTKDPDYHKTCPQCGITKSSADFYRNRSKKDGLVGECKDCVKQRNKAFYRDNPDRQKRIQETGRRREEMVRAVATVYGKYSPEEDLVVLDDTLTAYQKAIKLGRTFNSVKIRKKTLKKKGITHVSNYSQI